MKEPSPPSTDEDVESAGPKEPTSGDELDMDLQVSDSIPAEESVVSTNLETTGASAVAVAGPTNQAVSLNGADFSYKVEAL